MAIRNVVRIRRFDPGPDEPAGVGIPPAARIEGIGRSVYDTAKGGERVETAFHPRRTGLAILSLVRTACAVRELLGVLEGRSMENAYASPADQNGDANATIAMAHLSPEEAQRVRSERLKTEAALKQDSLALTGVYLLLTAVGVAFLFAPMSDQETIIDATFTAVMTVATAVSIVVNWGVRRLAAWTRIPLTVLCVLALPIYGVGRPFALDILRLIRRGQPPRLLSREYECVVRQTTHLTERTSMLTWIALFLIFLIVAFVIMIAQLPPEVRHLR